MSKSASIVGSSKTAGFRGRYKGAAPNAIPVLEIDAGSAEDMDRTALRRLNNAGAGEAGSIALAMRRLDLVFVTEDIRAVAGRAKLYRELPGDNGRILGLHAFLRMLVEHNALVADAARDVEAAAKAWSNLDPPRWWAAWAASNLATT